ncbi:MAG: metal ABC transporter permease [Thermoplasmata archaeon]
MSVPWSWNLFTDVRFMGQFSFIQHAYEAGTIIAIVAGIVGYFVVLRRSAFATHALGHVGFSGAAAAVVYGVNPVYGLLLFTMSGGTGMALLGRRAVSRDIEIGTVLAFMLGLGLLFLSLYRGYASEAYSLLFGEIEGIGSSEVLFTFEASLVVLALLALIYRPLLFASLDEDVAEARGLPMLALGLGFMLMLAVAISFAVQIVGVLLIFALMVTPAAIAIRLTQRPLYAVVVSIAVAVLVTWAGIFVAFFQGQFPVSFFIVTFAFVAYVVVRAAGASAQAVAMVRARGGLRHLGGRVASGLGSGERE